jgi:hypothetical protein
MGQGQKRATDDWAGKKGRYASLVETTKLSMYIAQQRPGLADQSRNKLCRGQSLRCIDHPKGKFPACEIVG